MSALTSLLARDQVVPVRKIEEALQKQVVSGGEMSSVLLELDALPENTLAAYCAALYQLLPATRDEVMRVPRDTVRIVPREIAERHRMIPLAVDGRTLVVAMAHPLNADVEEQLGFLLGFDLVTRIVCDARVSAGLMHHYGVDAAPRHVRLIEKLRQRDPGAVPYVAPARAGKIDRASLASALPTKARSTASGFLDDEDDDEAPIAPPAPVRRPSQVPSDGRPTDPMGVHVSKIPGAAAAAPAKPPAPSAGASAAPRPASIPPAPVVGVGVARSSERPPAPGAPAPTAAASSAGVSSAPGDRTSVPPTETQTALRKLRGPLTAAVGVKMLGEAHDRDSILEIFFAFARQFFDYSAIFVVHDDVADGRDAFGSGAPAAAVRRIAVPLDVPGVLGEVRRTLEPRVGRLDTSELDAIFLRDLARAEDTVAIVVPVAIRGRAVVLFYGDRSGDRFALRDVPELVGFVPRVVDAFEALILRRKRGSQQPGFEKPAPSARDGLKAAARAAALSAPPPRAAGTPVSAFPIDPLAEAPVRSVIPPASSLPRVVQAPLPSPSPADSGSMWERAPASNGTERPRGTERAVETEHPAEPDRRPRRASSANLEAAGALAADLVSSPPTPISTKPAAPIDVAALRRPGRTRTIQAMLGIPRDAPPPPESNLSLPPASEPPPRPPMAPQAAPRDDDEPELIIADAENGGQHAGVDEDEDDDPPDAASSAPVPLTNRARSSAPGTSTYIVRDAAVDVVGPRRRGSVPPPARSPGRTDPRAEAHGGDEPVRQDVIDVPATDARRSAPLEEMPARTAPPSASEEMPSVIVDMGDQVNALVVDLSRCGPDDESAAVDALLRIGEAALPTLAQAFPGPAWFDRKRPYRRLPRGRDVSAIARALVAFRERAVPYVASLLGAGQADRRFYAVLVAGELVHPGIVAALSERVFDDDDGVRAATLELLPRFRGIAGEWSDAVAIIRRAAKIRGRDPIRRRRATRALGAMRDPGALRILIELLEDEDHELGEVAHRSLVDISAEDMGTAARRWVPWLQKNESRHRIEWLIDALSHTDEAIRTSAGEELKNETQQYYGYHPASPRKEREVVQQKYRRWWDEEGRRLFAALSPS